MALICRIIRCILRSFAAQQIIFCNGSRRCASRSVISSNCNIVELIVLIFLYRIKILRQVIACSFFGHLKLCVVFIGNRADNCISIFQCLEFYQTLAITVLVIVILSYITFGVGCSTNQPCNSTHITISIIFMTRDCITCLIRCKILHWIKIICCNCIDISLRQWMQTGCFFQKPSSIRIICFDSCIPRFVNFCNNTVFIIVIGKRVCAICIGGLDDIAIRITVVLCRITHDVNAFRHFVILVFVINHVIGDFIYVVCLTISFNSICLDGIFFIIIICKSLDKRIAIILFQSCLFLYFVIGIHLFQTRCIGQPVHRTILVVHDLVCHFIVAVGDFAKSAVPIILICFSTARNAGC